MKKTVPIWIVLLVWDMVKKFYVTMFEHICCFMYVYVFDCCMYVCMLLSIIYIKYHCNLYIYIILVSSKNKTLYYISYYLTLLCLIFVFILICTCFFEYTYVLSYLIYIIIGSWMDDWVSLITQTCVNTQGRSYLGT